MEKGRVGTIDKNTGSLKKSGASSVGILKEITYCKYASCTHAPFTTLGITFRMCAFFSEIPYWQYVPKTQFYDTFLDDWLFLRKSLPIFTKKYFLNFFKTKLKRSKTNQKFCTFAGGNRKKEGPERGSPFLNTFFEKGLLFSGRELMDNCHNWNFWEVSKSDQKFCTFTGENRKKKAPKWCPNQWHDREQLS